MPMPGFLIMPWCARFYLLLLLRKEGEVDPPPYPLGEL